MALRDQLRASIERDREELAMRKAASSRLTGSWLDASMRVQTAQIRERLASQRGRAMDPNVFRPEAEWNARRSDRDGENAGMFAAGAIASLVWPVVWVLWAFAWRGGISFWLGGIALVRADGRRAHRWRCAWRALLFWLLPIALLMAAFAVDLAFWSNWRDPVAFVGIVVVPADPAGDLRCAGPMGPVAFLARPARGHVPGAALISLAHLRAAPTPCCYRPAWNFISVSRTCAPDGSAMSGSRTASRWTSPRPTCLRRRDGLPA